MPEIKKESMLASASIDRTPRVGIVLSSFKGGEEHDGTPLAGLASPRPAGAALTDSELDALLRKAIELSRRGRRDGAQIDGIGPEDWVVVRITPSSDVRLVRSLLGILIAARQGKRFTVAGEAPAPAGAAAMLETLARGRRGLRFEYMNLDTAPYLTAPAVRRTFAANNPDGVYAIPKIIRECDKLITVTPLDEGSAPTYWSIAPRAAYGAEREKLLALGDRADVLCDLYLHHPPGYAILGGPAQVRHNLVIAGRNAVSVDAVGAAVMGLDTKKITLLDKLEARGFGIADPDSIWTRGNEIEEARRPMEKPAAWSKL
jgi:hypothetical protein